MAVLLPGLDVTVYDVIALPPFETGAEKLTLALVLLTATTAPIVGAPGTVASITLLEAPDAAPVPIALLATTVNVYAVPGVRVVMVIGFVAPTAVNPPGLDVTV